MLEKLRISITLGAKEVEESTKPRKYKVVEGKKTDTTNKKPWEKDKPNGSLPF